MTNTHRITEKYKSALYKITPKQPLFLVPFDNTIKQTNKKACWAQALSYKSSQTGYQSS